ncbi:MAG: hypothetical protein QXP52_02255 [Candidatus Aenigmatarchaeota archaeon]
MYEKEDIFTLTQTLKELLQQAREEIGIFIKYREVINNTISALNEKVENLEKEIQKINEILNVKKYESDS